jgi:hypothetical protein
MIADGQNILILASWEAAGRRLRSRLDHHRGSADTPEQPISILPLI